MAQTMTTSQLVLADCGDRGGLCSLFAAGDGGRGVDWSLFPVSPHAPEADFVLSSVRNITDEAAHLADNMIACVISMGGRSMAVFPGARRNG